ncbi:hypothetical protein RUM44_013661 [Polyplax serrata]|uniref:Uncharacterized protein n=1 Tax=Polyplax serrata TaxID=468196 RepID=A0ABR1BET6_POLSC
MLRLIFGALMLGPLTTGLRDYSPMTNFFFLLQEKKSTPEEKVRPEDEEEKSKGRIQRHAMEDEHDPPEREDRV